MQTVTDMQAARLRGSVHSCACRNGTALRPWRAPVELPHDAAPNLFWLSLFSHLPQSKQDVQTSAIRCDPERAISVCVCASRDTVTPRGSGRDGESAAARPCSSNQPSSHQCTSPRGHCAHRRLVTLVNAVGQDTRGLVGAQGTVAVRGESSLT